MENLKKIWNKIKELVHKLLVCLHLAKDIVEDVKDVTPDIVEDVKEEIKDILEDVEDGIHR